MKNRLNPLLYLFLCGFVFLGACSESASTNTTVEGEMTAGEMTAGEMTVGEMAAGEMTAGEMTAGEMTAGEMTAGEMTAGEMTAGEMTAGEMTAGEMAAGEITQEEEMDMMAQRAFDWLSGRFDSVEQARNQPSYFEIQLLACEVIAEELGQRVLYIEQAPVASPDEPYRQRLYHIDARVNEDEEIEVISTIYSLMLPDAYVGLCADEAIVSFSPSSYVIREGCEVYLKWVDGRFEGSTRGEGCESTLNGASYATSDVILEADMIESWDRGFDAEGEQVWGAVDGAYEFVRKE